MQTSFHKYSFLLLIVILSTSCSKKVRKPEVTATPQIQAAGQKAAAGPPVIIYKTKKDYSSHVPIILSKDKKSVVSFPGIKDVFFNGSLAYPSKLQSGYLLDNRGIGPDAAFITLTYEQYSKLTVTPGAEELLTMILDADPFTEMYNCGSRYQYNNPAEEISQKIAEGKLGEFVRLK